MYFNKLRKLFPNLWVALLLLSSASCFGQNLKLDNTPDKKLFKMTSLAFGGTGVLFTQVNNQFTAMTGGRGSATFNNRFTFGGAGWGMPKGVELERSKADTIEFFKFGYGGLEFGYLFYASEKVSFGSHLLLACGAGFKESYPKTAGGFNLFPVIEPSVYSQISLGKLLKLDVGLTYRYVTGSKFSYINNRQLSGPSIYLAFLVCTCSCN